MAVAEDLSWIVFHYAGAAGAVGQVSFAFSHATLLRDLFLINWNFRDISEVFFVHQMEVSLRRVYLRVKFTLTYDPQE